MALKNAFGDVASEGMLRRLYAHLGSLARDNADRLIVNLSTGTLSNIDSIDWGINNGYANYYSQGAANSIDQRDLLRAGSRTNMQMARHHRWSFS